MFCQKKAIPNLKNQVFSVKKASKRVAKALFFFFLSFLLAVSQLFFVILIDVGPAYAQTILIGNPHKGYQYNFKGNLHCHTTNSDGFDSPSVVGQWYVDNGYDFYTITDHDYLTPNPGVSGIVWLGGAEEDSRDGSSGHMNHIDIINPINSGSDQTRINNAKSQGGITILNHASRSTGGWSDSSVVNLTNYLGLEIYNGGGIDSTSKWDCALSAGKLVWGFGADDSHQLTDRGRAYIILNSADASPAKEEILDQIRAGNFYSSRGFDLDVTVVDDTISAQTTNGSKIKWIKKNGVVIKTTDALSDSYTVDGNEQYVRIEILDGAGVAKAWSQPIRIYEARPNGLLIKGESSPKVYLLQGGNKCWIKSSLAFLSHGHKFSDVATVSDDELSFYPDGDTIKARAGTLIKSISSNRVYIVDSQGADYYRRWINSGQVFNGLGLKWENIRTITDQEIQEYASSSPIESTSTHPNGCLVKISSSPKIYWLRDGKKQWIATLFTFDSYEFDINSVISISESEMNSYEEDEVLQAREGSLVKVRGDSRVYITDYSGGTYYRRWITSSTTFTGLGLKWENIYRVSSTEMETYTEGEQID